MKRAATALSAALVLLLFSGVLHAGCGQHREDVVIEQAWIPKAPPVARVLAGYMTVENRTDSARTIVGAESPAFDRIEIHRTITRDGMSGMERQPRVEIPPRDRVRFSSGGLHLMLIDPRSPLKGGEEVTITLKFSDGETLAIPFTIRPAGAMEHDHQH